MLLFLQDILSLYVHVMSQKVKAKEVRISVVVLQTTTFDLHQVPLSLWTPTCPAATWSGWTTASAWPLHTLESINTPRFQKETSHDVVGFSRDPRLSLIKVKVERY